MTPNADHLEDGLLVRMLDDEAGPSGREAAAAHVAACATCAERLESLRSRSLALRARLAAADWPAPAVGPEQVLAAEREAWRRRGSARRPGPSWRAAAGIVLLLGAGTAVAVTPARAWISGWASAGWATVTGAVRDRGGSPAAGPAEAPNRVRFVPAGARLVVEFASVQVEGVLVLERTELDEVVAEALPALPAGADMIVRGDGIRVSNAPAARADYRIALPLSVESVEVRIGDGVPRVVERSALRSPMRIRLRE